MAAGQISAIRGYRDRCPRSRVQGTVRVRLVAVAAAAVRKDGSNKKGLCTDGRAGRLSSSDMSSAIRGRHSDGPPDSATMMQLVRPVHLQASRRVGPAEMRRSVGRGKCLAPTRRQAQRHQLRPREATAPGRHPARVIEAAVVDLGKTCRPARPSRRRALSAAA